MSKLIVAALAIAALGWSASASADCAGHEQSVSVPQTVVDGSGTTTPIVIPAPETKTGG
jgi:hypothetical protein